ncbi:hypothetical protein CHARACLAT_033623, partial [Characodon lateralis]|nr:hypothetical protein [Characodon lateralis]
MSTLKSSCLRSMRQVSLVHLAYCSLENIRYVLSECVYLSCFPPGRDSDLSTILLLLHLLPPTSKGHKKRSNISSCQAVDHVVRYLQ